MNFIKKIWSGVTAWVKKLFGKKEAPPPNTVTFTSTLKPPTNDVPVIDKQGRTSNWLRQLFARKNSFRNTSPMAHNPVQRTFGTFSRIKPLYMSRGRRVRILGNVNAN
jgi:hypothetical protein